MSSISQSKAWGAVAPLSADWRSNPMVAPNSCSYMYIIVIINRFKLMSSYQIDYLTCSKSFEELNLVVEMLHSLTLGCKKSHV
jgi:hypothetical protein